MMFIPRKRFVEHTLEAIEDDSNCKLLYIICCIGEIAGIARKSLIHVILLRTQKLQY